VSRTIILVYPPDVKSILNFILKWILLRAEDMYSPIFFKIIQKKAQIFTNKSPSIWSSFIHKQHIVTNPMYFYSDHSLYKWGRPFVYHATEDCFWSIPFVIYFFQSSFSVFIEFLLLNSLSCQMLAAQMFQSCWLSLSDRYLIRSQVYAHRFVPFLVENFACNFRLHIQHIDLSSDFEHFK